MIMDVERFAKNALIDGDMLNLLERSRLGEEFNLFEEMEKLGYTTEEITEAAGREMERQASEFRRMTDALLKRFFHQ